MATEGYLTAQNVLDEIATYFGGKVPSFFKRFADVDESLLKAKWTDYKRTLFGGSRLLPQRLKYMMMYEVVRGYSQCNRCIQIHADMLQDLGISQELMNELRDDLTKSRLIDEKSKNILTFTYHASAAPKGNLDEKVVEAFFGLVGEKELTEIAALVSTCKALQDFIHVLHLRH